MASGIVMTLESGEKQQSKQKMALARLDVTRERLSLELTLMENFP
jgi:hypothetical protein